MSTFRYFAHGLGIHSPAPLRGGTSPDARCDVTIRFSSAAPPVAAADGESLIRFSDGVIYSIRDGREITAYTDLPITNDSAEFLGGNALAVLLQQRGAAVLHASCAAMNGSAVAFAGPSGAGKSSLLAALLQRGYSIVADDFVAFPSDARINNVQRGFPEVRLWPDTAQALRIALPVPTNGSPKATWDVATQDGSATHTVNAANNGNAAHTGNAANAVNHDVAGGVSASAIFFLSDGERVRAERMSPRVALYELLSNSYCVSLLDRDDLRDEFARWTAVAHALPCYRLTRPRDFAKIPDVVRLIESCSAFVDAA